MSNRPITSNPEDFSDDKLREAVIARLAQEPQISTSEIGTIASEGVVTLSGYVDDEIARQVAEDATLEVPGVRGVANELEIKPFSLLTDTDLAKTALQVLDSDPELGTAAVTIAVADGWLTLEGVVATAAQKEAAENAVKDLFGVRGVTNQIQIRG